MSSGPQEERRRVVCHRTHSRTEHHVPTCPPPPRKRWSRYECESSANRRKHQAHQRRHLHLQPAQWPALPQDHPLQCVGRPKAPQSAEQVEDCGGGGCLGSLPTRRRAAQTHHRHSQGHAGPSRSASPRFPQHRHHRVGTATPLPSRREIGEIRRPHPQSHRTPNGSFQHLRRLAQNHQFLHRLLAPDPHPPSPAREPREGPHAPPPRPIHRNPPPPRLAQSLR
mmetsp:Transcript_5650/g.10708  ORF Transcript_5650/g.10708 Transcript_5650/m.10708 type:complete len:224 (+) Transcript_5650:1851-2522(+)